MKINSQRAVLVSDVIRSSFDLWLIRKSLFFEPLAGLLISPPCCTSPRTKIGISAARMLSLRRHGEFGLASADSTPPMKPPHCVRAGGAQGPFPVLTPSTPAPS